MPSANTHSILAPSSSERWINCTPSALLAEKAGDDKGSVYADEGTLAHRIAELWLLYLFSHTGRNIRHLPNSKTMKTYFTTLDDEIYNNPLFYDDMPDEVEMYVNHVLGLLKASGQGAKMDVEAKYPLFYKPEDSGTIDSLISGGKDNTLYITDLKFGRGVHVKAENNTQLLIYAINAYEQLHNRCRIQKIVMTIVQPRLNSISKWEIDLHRMQQEKLVILAKARRALKGEGDFKPGTHCRFCPVKPRCRALKNETSVLAKKQFDDPALLTDNEIAEVLGASDVIIDWLVALKKYALERAMEGVRFEGYKLVAGNSRRQITDEKAILKALAAAGYESMLFKRMSLVTIGELTKTVNKEDFETCCAPWITKPETPPVLVEATDPRPEYGVAKAVETFAEFLK